jgi:hypothetical protein
MHTEIPSILGYSEEELRLMMLKAIMHEVSYLHAHASV